ncbi:MAG: hypothetical protein ACYTAS_18960, partial [Planctomycetota bacterium]
MDERGVAFRTACTTAKVTGVFSFIFLGLLFGSFIVSAVIGPRRENQLTEMKAQLQAEGGSDEKLAAIRELDVKIRRGRLWRLDFARKTSYVLLGSIVLFVAAGKLAGVLSRRPPRPQHAPDIGAEQIREAQQSRWGVTTGIAVLALAAGAGTYLSDPPDFAEAKETGPSYASMAEKQEQWHRFRGPGGAGVSV